MQIYDELVARGLIAQVTDEKEIRLINKELEHIDRYQSNISTKISKYQELENRKAILKERLTELGITH